ncbi:NAD(+) synthase [Erysipelothrix larvae]|uniref:Glutamine-dependent NAD(+) synthetase n=1 Tax=Erysipelothrix larvae TaxID=1514105 RepID=A0A0X8GYH4_9FIRM|nr:NAD(+) synthase [Erysipelothrix larvae]AMC92755.1 NAD(+) synthase [Erysipelothrix larvae]
MKCAIAQMRVKASQPYHNLKTIKHMIQKVHNAADFIVFPEMCVGGYFIADQYHQKDMQDLLLSMNQDIINMSGECGVIWGNIDVVDGKLYNAAFFAHKGALVGVYHKSLLPTYGVFDDARYFKSGHNFEPFEFKGKKIAIQICEDMWDETYEISPTQEALKYNPDYLINISCSPWIFKKESSRSAVINHKNLPIPFVYVNSVGLQNTGKSVLLMDGNSQVTYKDSCYALNDMFEEELAIVDLDHIKNASPIKTHKLYQGLLHAIRYFDEEALPYGPKWIIGVSGGLDSSVSATLLTHALGKERVIGVTMPSQFTRDITKSNAYHLSQTLGFKLHEIPIGDMVDATVKGLKTSGYPTVEGLTFENIQARLRGHTLMSVASLENGVVVNNGNKIEVALGYATLYGDAIGALSILGDLTKLEVGDLARSINDANNKEIIPHNLIPSDEGDMISWDFAPSAELAEGQFDPMKWGYHDHLVLYLMGGSINDLLKKYLDGSILDTNLGKYLKAYGLDDPEAFIKDLDWVSRQMRNAVYKRLQMPPIVLVSEQGFGSDYRESQIPQCISDETQALKTRVLHEGLGQR